MLVRAYKVTNTANGKAYIGITSASVQHRWRRHLYDAQRGRQVLLAAALREFGVEVFRVEALRGVQGRKAAALLERRLIKEHITLFPDGYNMTSGGEMNVGFTLSEVVREKQRQGRLGKKQPESAKRLISAANKGRKHTLETRLKMSRSHTGLQFSAKHLEAMHKVQATPEYRAKMRANSAKRKPRPWTPAEKAAARVRVLAFYKAHPEAIENLKVVAKTRLYDPANREKFLNGCREWQTNRTISAEERARRSAGARRGNLKRLLTGNTQSGVAL